MQTAHIFHFFFLLFFKYRKYFIFRVLKYPRSSFDAGSELHLKLNVRTDKRLNHNAHCECCRTLYHRSQVCSTNVFYAECGRNAIIEQLQKWMRIMAATIKNSPRETRYDTASDALDGISLFCPVNRLWACLAANGCTQNRRKENSNSVCAPLKRWIIQMPCRMRRPAGQLNQNKV